VLASAVLLTFLVHSSSAFELTNSIQLTTCFTYFADHSSSLTSSTVGVTSSTASSGSAQVVVVVIMPSGTGVIASPLAIVLGLGLPKPYLFLRFFS